MQTLIAKAQHAACAAVQKANVATCDALAATALVNVVLLPAQNAAARNAASATRQAALATTIANTALANAKCIADDIENVDDSICKSTFAVVCAAETAVQLTSANNMHDVCTAANVAYNAAVVAHNAAVANFVDRIIKSTEYACAIAERAIATAACVKQ